MVTQLAFMVPVPNLIYAGKYLFFHILVSNDPPVVHPASKKVRILIFKNN